MTIFNYIIRMIVAVVLGVSFIATSSMWYESRRYETRPDLANYISLIIFIMFAYLLWVIN